jgi:hypothetical protein
MNLIVRKNILTLPCWNAVPTESHRDGQNAGYFLRTLQTVLLALGYSEPPLFVIILRLLRGSRYLWRVRVFIYERPTTDHILLHPSCGRGYHTEVDVRGRHERGHTRSFGAATT